MVEISYIELFLFSVIIVLLLNEAFNNHKYKKDKILEYKELMDKIDNMERKIIELEKDNKRMYLFLYENNNKIKTCISELQILHNDLIMKYGLFIESLKSVKNNSERIMCNVYETVQYLYYYFGDENNTHNIDSKYFKVIIYSKKMDGFFNIIKDVENKTTKFFSPNFKTFMSKITEKNMGLK